MSRRVTADVPLVYSQFGMSNLPEDQGPSGVVGFGGFLMLFRVVVDRFLTCP